MNSRKLIYFIVVFILLSLIVHVSQQKVLSSGKIPREEAYDLPSVIPPAHILKFFSFGQETLIADILWLDMVQYMGSHARDRDIDILYTYIDTITDLDPKFSYAYEVGQLILPEINNIERAVDISRKAQIYIPEEWIFPYRLGFIYHYYSGDYEKAAEYYAKAASYDNALPSAASLAASAKAKQNKHKAAIIFWLDAYNSSTNPYTKEMAIRRMKQETNIVTLEEAAQKFKIQRERYPKNIEELLQTGHISEIPDDPEGYTYVWDNDKKRIILTLPNK